MSSTRSWAAAARAAGTIRQRKPAWTVHHAQNHALLGSPPAPPCWTSHLAFGLIGFAMPVVTLSFYILTVCYTRIYPLKRCHPCICICNISISASACNSCIKCDKDYEYKKYTTRWIGVLTSFFDREEFLALKHSSSLPHTYQLTIMH
jgi:hypothetical protein